MGLINYDRLWYHLGKLKALEERLQTLIAQEERYEGHADPSDKEELDAVRRDLITIREALDIAKFTSKENIEKWQPRILEVTKKLRFPVGTV